MITSIVSLKPKHYCLPLIIMMFAALSGCGTTNEKEITASPASSNGRSADTGDQEVKETNDTVSGADAVTLEGRDFVLAARFGQENIVRTMLNRGARVNSRDELGNTALIAAASEGHKNLVTLILSHGADVNMQSKDGTSALMAATIKGNIDIAKGLIDAGAKIDAKKNNGETALFDAAIHGHTGMVELLLAHGADPNIQNAGDVKTYEGYTPLMYAAQHGNGGQDIDWLAMANILLKNGAKPNITNHNDDTALSIAERNGFSDISAELRKLGARDEIQYAGMDREEALIRAAKLNDVVKARELLESAAKPNYRNNITGITALLMASYYGHLEIVRLLVEYGTDVNNVPWGLTSQRILSSSVSVNERGLLHAAADGDTALITVIRKDFPGISRFLLAHGADVNVANRNEEIPAFVAARLGRAEIMTQLLAKGADPDSSKPKKHIDPFITDINKENDVNPLLIEATVNGHTDTVEVILAAGADPDIRDHQGKTALYWAVSQGFLGTVKALLSHDADPDIKDEIGTTPLMVASKSGYMKMVELLLEKGAEINAVEGVDLAFGTGASKAGTTALIYASRGGHAEIVRLLLTKGADAGLTTSTGESALRAAKSNGHADVVKILTGLTFN